MLSFSEVFLFTSVLASQSISILHIGGVILYSLAAARCIEVAPVLESSELDDPL